MINIEESSHTKWPLKWAAPAPPAVLGRSHRRRDNRRMDIDSATPLLGGLSPSAFMRRHWQKKPLLVRQAWPAIQPPIGRAALFELAAQADVESRLLTRFDGHWRLRHGPLPRRALPALQKPNWTLLVQGLDLHWPAARALLDQFRFVPEARLDDVMLSYASDGGGVGPHLDSYDVFLLQVHGRRRWRIGPVPDCSLVDGLPIKVLRHFEATQEWLLETGDMLYLPPNWGHDGVAVGECMTCSIGFRAPAAAALAGELLARLADDLDLDSADQHRRYRDPHQSATTEPGRVPAALREFALSALQRAVGDADALARAVGCALTEPKAQVWFEATRATKSIAAAPIALDRRTRMQYDERHVFINGEAFRAAGRDARMLARLADARQLSAADGAKFSRDAAALVEEWRLAGWLHAVPAGQE